MFIMLLRILYGLLGRFYVVDRMVIWRFLLIAIHL